MRTSERISLAMFGLFLAMPVPFGGRAAHAQATTASITPAATAPAGPVPDGPIIPPLVRDSTEEGLRFNFRGVPLDTVLDYLSAAAGFVIIREAQVEGTVDVVSHRPLNKDEAVALLNTVLNDKGFAAIRNERYLTIVKREDAQKRGDLPVKTGADPESIPKTDEMVTQIIPVKYADVTQLVKNIEPLLPDYATLSANEGSNAVILTDTQVNVRRIAEIIKALDTSISQISRLKVFGLKYADAEEIANVITQIFEARSRAARSSSDRSRRIQEFFSRMRGGPPGGGRSSSSGSGSSQARQAQSLVVAVADTRTNSVVVSAPEEVMPVIEEMIQQVDTMSEDITELRVFTLRYADAEETAKLITDIFQEQNQSNRSDRPRRFGGGPFGFFRPPPSRSSSNQTTERKLQEETVSAVADTRTNSVVVRASSEVMAQIELMVKQLDTNPAKDKNVYVYSLQNANAEDVGAILESLFGSQNGRSSNLLNRTQNTRQTNTSRSGTRSSNRSTRGGSSLGSSSRGSVGGTNFGSLR